MNQYWKEPPMKRNLYNLETWLKILYIIMIIFKYDSCYVGIVVSLLALWRKKSLSNDFTMNLLYLTNLSLFKCTTSLMYHLPVVLHFCIGICEFINLRQGELLKTFKSYVLVGLNCKPYILEFRCKFELGLLPLSVLMCYISGESFMLVGLHLLFLITKYFASQDVFRQVVIRKSEQINSQKTQMDVPITQATQVQLDATVTNFNNTEESIGNLIKDKAQTFLVFVRHFNCFVCRDQVKNLNLTITQEELDKANIRIVVIACSKQGSIDEFSKDTGFPKEHIYVNPALNAYQAFGLEKASGMSQLRGDSGNNPDTTSGVVSGFAWSFWKTISRGTQGDVYQLGGQFLMNSSGEVTFAKASKSSQDYLSSKEVRELLKL